MKTVAIIQTRMGSTRLPGKVMKKVMGQSLLAHQIERLRDCKKIDELVIATTINEKDDCIQKFCEEQQLSYYRGSEQNVAERYYEAARMYNATEIVRLTSDCPLIDPEVVDNVIQFYQNNQYDYVSNVLTRTFPRGLDTEIFSFNSFEKIISKRLTVAEKEHVTLYYYTKGTQFSKGNIEHTKDLHHYRLTVDTLEDFQLIKIIFENLYVKNKKFRINDIENFLSQHPHLLSINAHIEQKVNL